MKALNRKLNLLIQKSDASVQKMPTDGTSEIKAEIAKIKNEVADLNSKILQHVIDESNNVAS